MRMTAIRPRTQLVVDITPEFRDALKILAAREYRTVSQTVLLALVKAYPELENPEDLLKNVGILNKVK